MAFSAIRIGAYETVKQKYVQISGAEGTLTLLGVRIAAGVTTGIINYRFLTTQTNLKALSQQALALRPALAGGGASERGRSTLFKKHLFFCQGVTIFITNWAQKNHLAFSSSSILSQDKILLLCDNFCNTLGTKKSPCFFFLFYIKSRQNSAAM